MQAIATETGFRGKVARTVKQSASPIGKKQMEFLDVQKVDENRLRIERIKNVLESQYDKQNSSLERNLRNQVH